MSKPTFFVAAASIAPILAAFALTPLACAGKNGDTGGNDGGTTTNEGGLSGNTPLPCNVNTVVVDNCQSCHSNPPQNGAPMPLVTWEDFQAVATNSTGLNPNGLKVYQLADQLIHSTKNQMPQPPNPALDTADMATMDSWTSAGAPAGTAACVGDAGATAPDGAPPSVQCSQDNVTLAPTSAWTMPQADTNDYVCYSVSVPGPSDGGTAHVLAITPNIDNHKIVHHVLLFQADPSDTSITSTPTPCSAGGSLTWRIVYGWAPGGGAMQTPPNVGFPYDSSTKWVVQVHYNNADGLSGETDSSGFSFCSTDQPVQYDSDVVAFGTQNINIPPHSALDETCNVTVSSLFAGIHPFAAFPHMHLTGTAIQTEQSISGGGGLVGMAENAPWDFNAQVWFPINATLNTGDVVSTRCAWLNTGDTTVTFGQDTENEMCYSFTAYYPKITSGAWSWALPAIASTCSPSADGGLPTPPGGWATGSGFGSDGGTVSDDAGSTPSTDDAGDGN